jgi:ABC-2 type transport system permease protein
MGSQETEAMKLFVSELGGWAVLRREARFIARERTVWGAWLLVMLLSILALAAGLREVGQQQALIARLIDADRTDRQAMQRAQTDWGSTAYYSFHLTFDPPSDFAFAALGHRDNVAWKHRIRMLALEGQIYERDAGHPVLALVGRLDFAFFAAFVLPLILIVLLHDTQSRERVAGRHDLLVVTARNPRELWRWRTGLLAAGVWLAAALPLLLAGALAGATATTVLAACSALAAYVVFWAVICSVMAAWRQPGEVILAALTTLWLVLGVLLPTAGRAVIDRAIPLPAGAEIVMIQREAVNDAWDLPKTATMTAFMDRHPQWMAFSAVKRPFEWKWYYAFQQVGDQRAASLSTAYTQGRLERDRWAGWLALAAPPVLMERALQSLAHTDLQASLAYEARVRSFHAELRAFYYPRLFREEPFDPAALEALPEFAESTAQGGR